MPHEVLRSIRPEKGQTIMKSPREIAYDVVNIAQAVHEHKSYDYDVDELVKALTELAEEVRKRTILDLIPKLSPKRLDDFLSRYGLSASQYTSWRIQKFFKKSKIKTTKDFLEFIIDWPRFSRELYVAKGLGKKSKNILREIRIKILTSWNLI